MSDVTIDPPTVQEVLDQADRNTTADGRRAEIEVTWAMRHGQRVVLKHAQGRARGRLRREAEAVQAIGSSWLVELIELVDRDRCTALVLRDAGPHTLDRVDDLEVGPVLRALQRCGEALAAIHAAGWTHGRLRAEHVVVGPRGNVTICSLGSARPSSGQPDAVRADVSALVELASSVTADLERRPGRRDRTVRQLRHLLDDLAEHPDAVTAERFAASIASVRRGERVGRSRRRSRPRMAVHQRRNWALQRPLRSLRGPIAPHRVVAGAAAVAFALAGVAALVTLPTPEALGTDASHPASTPSTTTLQPTPPTVVLPTGTYRVGVPGDQAVVGDWDCDGYPTVRLLRPATGEVFAFEDPPDATDPVTHGRLLDQIDGAESIQLERPPSAACDRAIVLRGDGTEEVIP